MVRRDTLERQVLRGPLDRRVRRATLERLARRARLDLLDRSDLRVPKGWQAPREILERPVRLARRVIREPSVPRVRRATLERLALEGRQALRVPKA